ncbi:MAG: Uma2 family endonuclease [Armatimonadetes bacterium]|nr:Uma2 family endonuclease [Armatimonadota bacterium]
MLLDPQLASDAGVKQFDPQVHPPPDLVLEIDVSRSSINRIHMLGVMGVPEVWRYRRSGELEVRVQEQPGEYTLVTASRVLPAFEPSTLVTFLAEHPGLSISGLVRAFRKTL